MMPLVRHIEPLYAGRGERGTRAARFHPLGGLQIARVAMMRRISAAKTGLAMIPTQGAWLMCWAAWPLYSVDNNATQ